MKQLWCISMVVLLMIVIVSSCKEKTAKGFKPILSDTTVDKKFNLAMQDFTQKLQQPSIRNGVDSFEYRFWLFGDRSDINLLRIRFENSRWIISETLIWYHIPEYQMNKYDTANHLLETIVDSTKTSVLTASIAMNDFIDSLQSYNLEQAPLDAHIEHSYTPHMDGVSQTIEIADKKSYRVFVYPCPISISSLKDFHRSMKTLFHFLQRKLGAKFIPC